MTTRGDKGLVLGLIRRSPGALPVQADRARNRHRGGAQWMLITVAAILANPRYTGRQVWNRQRTDHDELESVDGLARRHDTERWNLATQWAISAGPAHPALVSDSDSVAVQDVHTAPIPADGSTRIYALTGLVFCGLCGRALDAHWMHGRAGYRCRHGRSSAHSPNPGRPRILYCREDQLLELLQRDTALCRAHPRLRHATAAGAAAVLRQHDMILVGDHHCWTLETDDTTTR